RLSGEGQPIIGRMYPQGGNSYGNPGASTARAYNNAGSRQNDWITSSYDENTGIYTAYIKGETREYNQTTEYNGANEYITIGNCEHEFSGGFDTTNFGASFIISDITISLCSIDGSDTVVAENIAPEMVAGNYCFGPSSDTMDDLSAWHYYTSNSSNTTNSYKTGFCFTPLNKWYADGAYQQIKAIDRNACNAAAHTLVHHTATANTIEYWSCAACAKNYVDKYASAECDTIYATPKMIAVKASGSRPGNAFITIDTPSSEGTHYYKFTCDMRIFGDDVPTISTVKGSYWGGNNAQSETGWTNNSDEANDEGLYASYDAETKKYEAIFKVDHRNHEYPSKYFNAVSGAYAALILGNGRHIGANGYDNTKYYSSFIFGNPQIVEVDKENNFAEIGENICPAISDKTLNFGTSYSGQTQQVYNTENTMHQTNNILAAPVGKWNVDGDRSWVVSMDIPDETFFTQDQGFAPKMLRTSGSGTVYNAISTQAFLKPDETYQFDIDYREFGSPARIFLQTATSSGYSTLVGTPTADNVDGAHKSIKFTMPSDARNTGDGNFRIYLGQSTPNGTNKNTTTVNFANAQLRWYNTEDNEVQGANIFMNGSFDFGNVGDITSENSNVTLFGWKAESVTTFRKHDLITIPEGFFDGDIGENNYAMKINAKGGVYLRTAVELLPNSVYELSYNYRATDDDINIGIKTQGDTDLTYTTSLVSTHTADKFNKTYTITTGGTTDGYQSGNTQANTIIEFRCPANADGNILYISNVQLHKVENNAFVGMNMLGDRNAIYDPATYYPANENNFTFASDNNWKAQSMIDDLGHAWWGSTTSTSDANRSTITGSIVKVNDNFFTYLAPATRLAKLTEVLLGKADASNPYLDKTCLYYNPDGKGTTNILDLVKVKKDIVNIDDEGGAGAEAAAMLSTINNAANTNTGSKTTYKVAKSATTASLISTLSNAANNSVVLLERGGVWRIPANEADGFALKNGISLGAYGTGAKPTLIGSAYNYASRTWTQVTTNIWKTSIESEQSGNRPGNVYFYDNGTYKTTPLIGRIIKDGARFTSYSQLEKEGDVYYDITNEHFTGDKNVYVYSTSNPATKYTDIEIGEKRDVLALVGYNTVDNICIKYAGGHGINATSRNSITIKNCEIAYVGGTPNGSEETMGNGIQFGLGGSNLTVDSCYVHDCYDAGLTFQSWSGQYTFDGVNFTNNLLVDNFYNIEFFTTGTSANKEGSNGSDGTMKNINISGNIMRFAGGWSFNQRQGNQLRCANIGVTQGAYYVNTQNLKITGNIFDCTMVQHVMWTWGFGTHTSDTNHPGLTISGNTYYQKAGSLDGRVNRFGCVSGTAYDYAGSTDTLKTAIAKMDTRPTKIAWVNRTDKF
ncbi:MAG: right-handed parallel beta-helix repeat-containing protein, partial [Clostridia bacterium]|nr:right-handed parallel beta-helix repeat-containing protein [Clostridia bacterium]